MIKSISSAEELRMQIELAKRTGDHAFFARILDPEQNVGTILQVLRLLGRLPAQFNPNPLLKLATHSNDLVRLAAVKALARVENPGLLHFYKGRLSEELTTLVRRELVSAIGRLRHEEAIETLINMLRDPDPKVVLQAVRGLLCFREIPAVRHALQEVQDAHPNELVQDVVRQALQPDASSDAKHPHPQSLDTLHNLMVHGDVIEVIKQVPDESVHLTFTSPPYYNARDYALYQSYEEYINFLTQVFREVHRITKDGRFFVLNTSPVLVPRTSRQHSSKRYAIPFDLHPRITALGFDFVDDIIWVKPAPSARNRNGGFYQHRKPLAYKANPVTEYIMVYRKSSSRLIDWNIRQYPQDTVDASKVLERYEPTNLWTIAPAADPVHPAVFPLELALQIIKLYSYKGDLVFDPFAGRGTVGQAALKLERYFFMVEKESAYIDYARRFLLHDQPLFVPRKPIKFMEFEEFKGNLIHRGKSDAAS